MKQWYKSKTIWTAVLQAVAGILTVVLAEYPALEAVGYILFLKSFVDSALRFITYQPPVLGEVSQGFDRVSVLLCIAMRKICCPE